MKCKHLKDGICEKLSDGEVKQPCVEGPCEFDTAVSKLKTEEARTEGYRTGFADGYAHGRRSVFDGKPEGEPDAVLDLMTKGNAIQRNEAAIAFAKSKRSLIRNGKLNTKSTIAERTGTAMMLTEILEILEGKQV